MLLAACSPDRTTLEVTSITRPAFDATTCAISATGATQGVSLADGSLNLNLVKQYTVTVGFVNNLAKVSTGITQLDSPNANDFFLSQMEFVYSCADVAAKCAGFPKIPNQIAKVAGTVPSGGKFFLTSGILTSDAEDKIESWIGPDPVLLTVGIKLGGVFGNGSNFTSEAYNFPIYMYARAKPACTLPAVLQAVGSPPCAALVGQDSDYQCVAPP